MNDLVAKRDFKTRTMRVRGGQTLTPEVLADAALSAEELVAQGFASPPGETAAVAPASGPVATGHGAEDGPAEKPAKRR